MQSKTFGNFQIGMLDNPSVEDGGGFEFASGMDIFSEPGVLKACPAMLELTYGAGASPSAVPLWLTETADTSGNSYVFIAAGSKLLQSVNNSVLNLLLTNSKGTIKGLGVWNGYVFYPADGYVGIVQVGGSSGTDDYHSYGSFVISDYYPVIQQGGTLKIGAGRYITSVDEAFAFTNEVFKAPNNYFILSMVEHFQKVFMGTKNQYTAGTATIGGASMFSWNGIPLSTGSALPDASYPMTLRGLPALLSDGKNLFGFPDRKGDIFLFDGVGFTSLRKLYYIANKGGDLVVNPGAVSQYLNTILFAGSTTVVPGVFQMQNGAVCQSFVPAGATPGVDATFNIGLVKTASDGVVYIGYKKNSDSSYHIEKSTSNKQNNAMMQTIWHRMNTDKKKRWAGIKLNLKPMAASTSVAVSYRTDRDASFTSSGVTISSSNQDKPIIFPAQPRSREIQFKFTYTTNLTTTPELLSYDPIFEVLKTNS